MTNIIYYFYTVLKLFSQSFSINDCQCPEAIVTHI